MRLLLDGCAGCEAFSTGCDLVTQYRVARLAVHATADSTARALLSTADTLNRIQMSVARDDLPVVVTRVSLDEKAVSLQRQALQVFDDSGTPFYDSMEAVITASALVAQCPQRSAA